MRAPSWRATAGLVVSMLLVLPPSSRALGLVSDERHVRNFERDFTNGEVSDETVVPAAEFAPFAHSGAWASQQSSVSFANLGLAMVWTASGFATAFTDVDLGEGRGDSRFRIRFRIDGSGSVALSGPIHAAGGNYDCCTLVSVELASDGGVLLSTTVYDDPLFPDSDELLDFASPLPAGEYWIDVTARGATAGFSGGSGTYDVRLTVSDTVKPIPETTTALVVSLGLAMLAGSRRARSLAALSLPT